MELLVVIARVDSVTPVPQCVVPSRLGFEILYREQLRKRLHSKFGELIISSPGEAAYALIVRDVRGSITYEPMTLYGGRSVGLEPSIKNWAAAVKNGICVFWSSLSKTNPEDVPVGYVTVVCGQIEFNKRSYSLFLDQRIVPTHYLDSLIPSIIFSSRELYLIITEKIDVLYVHFEVGNHEKSIPKIKFEIDGINKCWPLVLGAVSCENIGRCRKLGSSFQVNTLYPGCSTYKSREFELLY